jgi:FAD/FMN-containing dehydrogenase/Fe-S oxidoreductase
MPRTSPPLAVGFAALARALPPQIAGALRTDRLARALYATDASIYEIIPDGVLLPRSSADIVAALRLCQLHDVPLTARGAGTGLSGGCVNRGLQVDCGRLNRVLEIDVARRTARVEPGVVLDELNALLRPHGLQFPPDVATSSRATIGGMIANNSAGAHSIIHGRTCDHVLSIDLLLAEGVPTTFTNAQPSAATPAHIDRTLRAVLHEHAAEIAARFPRVLRSNGGYALDRLAGPDDTLNLASFLCGSEGTLGVISGATLNLVPLPRHKGLVVIHFTELLAALHAVPRLLTHQPAAVELLDRTILAATHDNPHMAAKRGFLVGDPAAILIVELYDEDAGRLAERLRVLVADVVAEKLGYACPLISDSARQQDVWDVRKAGTGLLMSRPGPVQPYDFVDDTAVDPARLGAYMTRFGEILREEGIQLAGYYGHASVGLLHVRPALNLQLPDDIARLRRIGERVSSLVAEFGGAMTGEHGDGIVRSCWLEKTYGPRLVAAFRQIKQAFDPRGLLNPGKIVDPLPMDGTLRYGADFVVQQPATLLDFDVHDGMAGMAHKCEGIGQCRQRLVGTMCPSFQATGAEEHSTRGRANALRLALSNRGLLEGLADPALEEVMDLCLSCKACKTECPTGVDMGRLKAEWLHHRNERAGVPRRSRLIAASVGLAAWGCHFAPLSNWALQSGVVRLLMEHIAGLDRRMPPPRFARQTFRAWYARRRAASRAPAPRSAGQDRRVLYFVDTWTNFYQPEVGRATVGVLEALGCEVVVVDNACCGRPLLSKGLLRAAQALAERNVALLGPYAAAGVPIVGTEPSCVSVLLDELPQLVRTPAAREIARRALTIESFVAAHLRDHPSVWRAGAAAPALLYHGHCHQKALTGTSDALTVLAACTGGRAQEINSGCCGMAGAFGHEVEHYDVARAIGEQRLFPAVRTRGDAQVAVSGFSCRHHIAHHTGVAPRHVVEYLADVLLTPAPP